MNLIIVLLGIGAVILVHELGHFLAARYAGVRVETFSIGFGPRLFGWKRGGVDYRVSLVPLGGYVKMSGEEPGSGSGDEGDLGSKSVGQRLLIFSAGVIMNFLFALVGFAVAFSVGVPFRPPVIGKVIPGGPAWEAGIQEGSRVLAVGDTRVLSFADISTSVALGGDRVVFTILPPGGEKSPRKVVVHPFFDKTTGFNRILVEAPMEDKVILHVAPGGPAEKAGLREGDELLLVDGRDARNMDAKEMTALLEKPRPRSWITSPTMGKMRMVGLMRPARSAAASAFGRPTSSSRKRTERVRLLSSTVSGSMMKRFPRPRSEKFLTISFPSAPTPTTSTRARSSSSRSHQGINSRRW